MDDFAIDPSEFVPWKRLYSLEDDVRELERHVPAGDLNTDELKVLRVGIFQVEQQCERTKAKTAGIQQGVEDAEEAVELRSKAEDLRLNIEKTDRSGRESLRLLKGFHTNRCCYLAFYLLSFLSL